MKKTIRGKLWVGTSGVVVPVAKQFFPVEYQQSSRLSYYASFLNSLEINSTFYKLPRVATVQRWTGEVPGDFCFTVKLWREVSHNKKLVFEIDNVQSFIGAVDYFGAKKACLLIQFPASISFEYLPQLEALLSTIQGIDAANIWRKAIEFRSESWYNNNTHHLLDRYGASVVLHDMPKSQNWTVNVDASFVYYRFHGPAGDYRGSYDEEFLQEKSQQINNWLQSGKDVYAYFNNTMGSAFDNALNLQRMVEAKVYP